MADASAATRRLSLGLMVNYVYLDHRARQSKLANSWSEHLDSTSLANAISIDWSENKNAYDEHVFHQVENRSQLFSNDGRVIISPLVASLLLDGELIDDKSD
jgi:hypothetical protein